MVAIRQSCRSIQLLLAIQLPDAQPSCSSLPQRSKLAATAAAPPAAAPALTAACRGASVQLWPGAHAVTATHRICPAWPPDAPAGAAERDTQALLVVALHQQAGAAARQLLRRAEHHLCSSGRRGGVEWGLQGIKGCKTVTFARPLPPARRRRRRRPCIPARSRAKEAHRPLRPATGARNWVCRSCGRLLTVMGCARWTRGRVTLQRRPSRLLETAGRYASVGARAPPLQRRHAKGPPAGLASRTCWAPPWSP